MMINPTPSHVRTHCSGLRLLLIAAPPTQRHTQTHIVALPPLCPVSGNPKKGSVLSLTYQPIDEALEVYSLHRLLRRFEGGWPGTLHYPAARDLEGALRLIAQMCAHALAVPVTLHAAIVLDVGAMSIIIAASPDD
jgi:7-cyano-7-deazaguanine reductase